MTPISKHFRGSLTNGGTRNELYEVRPPNDRTGEPIFYLATVHRNSPLGLGPEHVPSRVIAMGSAVDLLNHSAFEPCDPTAKREPLETPELAAERDAFAAAAGLKRPAPPKEWGSESINRSHFDHLEPCDDEAGLLGTLHVFGTPFHFQFVEVTEQETGWEPVNDPYDRLADFQNVDTEARYMATKIDGKFYIGCATPYGE